MNLRDLKTEIAAVRLHDLAETNVLGVVIEAGAVFVQYDDSDILADLAEAREERDEAIKENKELEAENRELERRVNELESLAENGGPDLLAQAFDDVARFRGTATAWAQEVQALRAELTAIRKRKGVAAGVCAYSHEVANLLGGVSQGADWHAQRARELLAKINLL